MQGFVVLDHFKDLLGEFYELFPKKIASGEIKHREHVYRGLEEAGKAIFDVQKGNNTAKAVVVLAD